MYVDTSSVLRNSTHDDLQEFMVRIFRWLKREQKWSCDWSLHIPKILQPRREEIHVVSCALSRPHKTGTRGSRSSNSNWEFLKHDTSSHTCVQEELSCSTLVFARTNVSDITLLYIANMGSKNHNEIQSITYFMLSIICAIEAVQNPNPQEYFKCSVTGCGGARNKHEAVACPAFAAYLYLLQLIHMVRDEYLNY